MKNTTRIDLLMKESQKRGIDFSGALIYACGMFLRLSSGLVIIAIVIAMIFFPKEINPVTYFIASISLATNICGVFMKWYGENDMKRSNAIFFTKYKDD